MITSLVAVTELAPFGPLMGGAIHAASAESRRWLTPAIGALGSIADETTRQVPPFSGESLRSQVWPDDVTQTANVDTP
jgi:hypothetical protein